MARIFSRHSFSILNRLIPHSIDCYIHLAKPFPLHVPKVTISTHYPSASTFTKSTAMGDTAAFLETTKLRRSYYQLSNESSISDARIQELVRHAISHVPSSFNSQTTRVVILLKGEHVKLWDAATEVHKASLSEEQFQRAEQRFKGFRAAYGTILFFEDTSRVREFQEKFKIYEDRFPPWSEQTNGMHQYFLWTALEAEGLGCNLQHYNPLIDVRVQTEWNLPTEWSLKSQLVFGTPTAESTLREKTFSPLEDRIKVFGAE
ncbi:hypothetical protein MMC22_004828 [Lobaria immixta]|nr:hypothetical protein [Lobaria immixta]